MKKDETICIIFIDETGVLKKTLITKVLAFILKFSISTNYFKSKRFILHWFSFY